ncbi:Pentafunctional AROM polypeptide [Orobanche hederae]
MIKGKRLLEAKYRPKGIYKDARTILVIHNLALQEFIHQAQRILSMY